jgi:photosystem II stability/assembly factor-like uncharacterized protein
MKKQLLSIFAALTVSSVMAQVPSPSWTISQNASFTVTSAGHRFMDAVDANVVWLAGYDGTAPGLNYNWFSRTINGGTSYNSGNIYSDTITYQLANLEGVDANTAWASAFMSASQSMGAIHKTTNGGATWVNMTAPGMYTNSAAFTNIVSFVTPNNGMTMGDPVNGEYEIWTTSNGGTTWTQVPGANIPNPTSGEFGIVDLYCKQGTSNYWFGTQKGRIYRSTDAGLTWNVSALASAPNSTVTELAFSTANNGIIYAQGTGGLEVYNTTDGGATWNLISPTPANIGRNDICGIPGTSFFASVDNQNGLISYSTNNGLTWTDWGSTGIGYVCIDFANSFTGWSGSFSDAANPSLGGIWKYNGTTFNSAFTIDQFLCKPAGNATVVPVNTSTGSASPFTFTWTSNPATAAFSNANATNPVITFTATGVYTISLAAQNPNGTSNSTQVITVLTCAAPSASFNMQATACNNVVITLTNTSVGAPNPAISITSNPATNVTITPGSGSLYTARFGTAGTYTLSLVASNAAGSNTYTQSILINNCTPTVGFTFPAAMCTLKDTVLTVNTTAGAISYTWSIAPTSGVGLFTTVGINKRITFFTPNTYTLTLRATNTSGTNSAVQVITVSENCTGIFENTNLANSIKVYPNPAHDLLNVILPADNESIRVKLTNVLGSVVYDEKISGVTKEKVTINTSNNAKGVYFLTVETKNEKATQKIIIE